MAILGVFVQTIGVCQAATPSVAAAPASEAAWLLARAALGEFQAGRYARSAELYGEAWRIDPAHPGYLFGVGRAEQKAGHWQAAIAAYEKLLTLVPATDPIASRARNALKVVRNAATAAAVRAGAAVPVPVPLPAAATPDQVELARTATPVALSAPATPAVAASPAIVLRAPATPVKVSPPSSSRASAWLVAGLGAACLLGSGATAWDAWQSDRAADRYRLAGSPRFDPGKISEPAAAARIDAINAERGLALGLGLVAAAALAFSAWWLRSDRDTTPNSEVSP